MGGGCSKQSEGFDIFADAQMHLKSANTAANNNRHKEALIDYAKAIQYFEVSKEAKAYPNSSVNTFLTQTFLRQGDSLKAQHQYQAARLSYAKAQALGSSEADERLAEFVTSLASAENIAHSPAEGSMTKYALPIDEFKAPMLFKANLPVPAEAANSSPQLQIDNLKSVSELSLRLQSFAENNEHYQTHYRFTLEIIDLFAKRKIKDKDLIAEIIPLVKVQHKEILHHLLDTFVTPIIESPLSNIALITGLAEILKYANPAQFEHDDLVQSLSVITKRLLEMHQQFTKQGNEDSHFEFLKAIAQLLDAMVDIGMEGLKRVEQHQMLYDALGVYSEGRLGFMAEYCRQALVRISNDESKWAKYFRKGKAAGKGLYAIYSAVSGLDASQLLEAYESIKIAVEHQVEQQSWYDALRYAILLQEANHWLGFEYFIKHNPDKRKAPFVAGVIQILHQTIRKHPNLEVRLKALELLGQFFEYSQDWEAESSVIDRLKVWDKKEGFIPAVLDDIVEYARDSDVDTRNAARAIFKRWHSEPFEKAIYLKRMPNIEQLPIKLKVPAFISTELLNAALKEYKLSLMVEQFLNAPVTFNQSRAAWHLPNSAISFVGRKALLTTMAQTLASDTQGLVCVGLGGIGKTQLVLQGAKEAPFKFKAWFLAETPGQLQQGFFELASSLGFSEKTSEGAKDFVKAYLENNPNWLLIFDNAEDYQSIESFIPATGGKVIVSTRNNNWPNGFKKLMVSEMAENDALELLESYTGKQEALALLAKALDYLPLALAQAGAYMQQNQINTKEYLELYQEQAHALLQDDTLPQGASVLPVAATWNASLKAIIQENPIALSLLTVCAYLSADSMPKAVLQAYHKDILKGSHLEFNKALGTLLKYSLLKATDGYLKMHRLVQTVIRHQHQNAAAHYQSINSEWLNNVAEVLYQEFQVEGTVLEKEARQKALLPHLKTYTEHYEALANVNTSIEFANLLSAIGKVLFYQNWEYKAAKNYYERALKIEEAHFGPEHPNVASTLGNLGSAYSALGDAKTAKNYYERALKIYEAHYGPEHPNVASTLGNLGVAYRGLGDAKTAKNYHEQALKIEEAHFGPEHPNVASTLVNLGNTYSALGDAKTAKNYYERALKIYEAHYGPEHPNVASTLVNLGNAYWDLGDVKTAKNYYERALKIGEAHFGPEHPKVISLKQALEKTKALISKVGAASVAPLIYSNAGRGVGSGSDNASGEIDEQGEMAAIKVAVGKI